MTGVLVDPDFARNDWVLVDPDFVYMWILLTARLYSDLRAMTGFLVNPDFAGDDWVSGGP
jgi:hypothetical protein